MRRLIYCPAGRETWFGVARRLADAGVATPVLWLGDPRHETAARRAFPGAEVLPFAPFRAGTLPDAPPLSAAYPGFWTSPNADRARERGEKLIDRIDWLGTHRAPARALLIDGLIARLLDAVHRTRPDAMVMAESPHAPATLILSEIAEFLGLDVLTFQATVLAPGLILRRGTTGPALPRPDGLATPVWDALAARTIPAAVARIAAPAGEEPDYMRRHRAREATASRRLPPDAALPDTDGVYEADRVTPRGILGLKSLIAARTARLAQALDRAASPDLPDRYAYLPLHYEPEKTSLPDGGPFHDQFALIATLRAWLPAEVGIAVKEHPSQVMRTQRGFLGRTPAFYRLAAGIRGVTVVPPETPSRDLIAGSEMVASLTGSAALEAAILGRRALTFGTCWYEGAPNTHRFEERPSFADLTAPAAPASAVQDWLLDQARTRAVPGVVNPSNARLWSDALATPGLAAEEAEGIVAALSSALDDSGKAI